MSPFSSFSAPIGTQSLFRRARYPQRAQCQGVHLGVRQEPHPVADAHRRRRRRRRHVRDDRSRHGARRHRLQVSPELDPDEADLQQLAGRHFAEPVGQDSGEAARLQEVAPGLRDQVSIL